MAAAVAASRVAASAPVLDDDGLGVSALNGTSGSASSMRGRPYISVMALSWVVVVIVV